MIRVGLIGLGKAGTAVAQVLNDAPRFDLRWVAKRTPAANGLTFGPMAIPIIDLAGTHMSSWLDQNPVDAIVDFSAPASLMIYAEELKRRKLMLVSAISAYDEDQLNQARGLGQHTRVMCSPNITLGINFLIMAAKLLRNIAPLADVEILEQHFKEKSEVSGTAKKLPRALTCLTKKSHCFVWAERFA